MIAGKRSLGVFSFFLLLVLLITLLPGCSGKTETKTIWGQVLLDKPLAGADITIYDLNGKQIFEAENATSTAGAFYLNVPGLSASFFIVATGGTFKGQPFNGSVAGEACNYAEGDDIILTPVTSLAAAYRWRHPETDYYRAQAIVENFLDMPAGMTANDAVASTGSYGGFFASALFLAQADSAGGFNLFIESLSEELEEGKNHPFIPADNAAIEQGFEDAARFAGKYAWGIIEKKVPGLDFVMGIFKSIIPGQPSELQEIQKKLDKMKGQLDDIQRQISNLDAHLTQLSEQITDSFVKQQWQIAQTAIRDPVTYIETQFTNFDKASNTVLTNEEEVKATQDELEIMRNAITNSPYDLQKNLDKIHQNVIGDGGFLHAWTDKVISRQSTDVAGDYQSIESLFGNLLVTQVKGIVLQVESWMNKPNETRAREYLTDYTSKLKQQVQVFLNEVDRYVLSNYHANDAQFLTQSDDILTRADSFAMRVLNALEKPPKNYASFEAFVEEMESGKNDYPSLTVRVKYDPAQYKDSQSPANWNELKLKHSDKVFTLSRVNVTRVSDPLISGSGVESVIVRFRYPQEVAADLTKDVVLAGVYEIEPKDPHKGVFDGYPAMVVNNSVAAASLSIFNANPAPYNKIVNKLSQMGLDIYYYTVGTRVEKYGEGYIVNPDNAWLATQWEYWGLPNQKWSLNSTGGGYFTLANNFTKSRLRVEHPDDEGSRLYDHGEWVGDDLQWKLHLRTNGYYVIANKHNGKLMTVSNASTQHGKNIVQKKSVPDGSQEWQIASVEQYALEVQKFKFVNKGSGKVFDDAYRHKGEGAGVIQWTNKDNDDTNQWWILEPHGNFFAFKNENSEKYLTVKDASTKEFARMVQESYTGKDAQLFTITPSQHTGYYEQGEICYEIKPKINSYVLGVDSNNNGANLIQCEWPGTWGMFKLQPSK